MRGGLGGPRRPTAPRAIIQSIASLVRFRRFIPSGRARRLSRASNIDDLRSLAQRHLPAGVFDYIDGGAEDETTLRNNCGAFKRLRIVPSVLNDVSEIDVSTSLFGSCLSFPLVLAPTGFTRIADPEGELAVARSAARAGIPYALSTLATRSIEEVSAVGHRNMWFQVYVWRDRALVREMLERAAACGYRAIVVTVDTPVLGRRERDVRRGFSLPPKLGIDTLGDVVRHPRWLWTLLRSDPIRFANVTARAGIDGSDPVSLSEYIAKQFDPSLSWRDIEWLRDSWPGPLVLKGIQSVADAKIAAKLGVEGVAISNHGGRQLDGVSAPIEILPRVVDEVGGEATVLVDGGIRRGSDIVKALAMGASACMVGRPYLYGLAASGEAGVDWALEHLRSGLENAMALCGCPRVTDLNRDFVAYQSETTWGPVPL